jgi:hypothetical protein
VDVPCPKEGSFPADAWITGLSVWGAEANWGKQWFDHQFAKTMPNKVCHLSAGQKFFYCLTSLEGMPNGAELAADFNAGWQSEIDSNAPGLSPAGCNGQRGGPLNYATVDHFVICPPGQTQQTDAPVFQPQSETPVGKSPGLIAKEAAAAAVAAAAAAEKKKKKAAEDAKKCRPLALWNYWFRSTNGVQSKIITKLTNDRLHWLDIEKDRENTIVALMTGKKVKGYDLDHVFPTDGGYISAAKNKTKHIWGASYGAKTHAEAIELAYQDPVLISTIFSHCPTSLDDEDTGTDADTDDGLMSGSGGMILAGLALWALSK